MSSAPATQSAFRRILWPTVACIVGVAILLALGFWQMQRLEWKEGLISRIEDRATATPMTLEEAFAIYEDTGDIEYLRVEARGEFWYEGEIRMFAGGADGTGWQVITPFRPDGSGVFLLVNRGYVPDADYATMERPAGPVNVVGLLRGGGRPSAFTPDNDPEANIWFWRDLDAMIDYASDAVRIRALFEAFPFLLEAEDDDDGLWPRGGVTRLELPNKHLEYALTWFGMAAALIAVYAVFVFGRLKSREGSSGETSE